MLQIGQITQRLFLACQAIGELITQRDQARDFVAVLAPQILVESLALLKLVQATGVHLESIQESLELRGGIGCKVGGCLELLVGGG